ELFPVCSPKLLNGRNRLRTPSDLSRFALLHVNDRQGWRQWLDFADVSDVDAARGPVLNQASKAIDAAGRRPARAACPHRACGLGFDRRPPGASIRYRNAGVVRVLDRLLKGGRQAAENRGVQ